MWTIYVVLCYQKFIMKLLRNLITATKLSKFLNYWNEQLYPGAVRVDYIIVALLEMIL